MKLSAQISLSAAVSLAVHSMAVQAQQQGRTAPEVGEIVVTATRRSETVLDVPYNITAVSAETLAAAGVNDTAAMIRMVPGLATFDEGPRVSGNRNNLNIRGLNANSLGNADDNPRIGQATVSTYVGETPVFFPLKLVDMERVEVLRGPQGTLYGSGSVGGTVRYIPRKPDSEAFSLDATVEGSTTQESDDLGFEAYATVNVPITEKAAIRASLGHERIPGFIDAVNLAQQTGTPRNPGAVIPADPDNLQTSPPAIAPPQEDVNEADVTFGRLALLWEPTDRLQLTLGYHYQKSEADSRYEDNPAFGTGEEYVIYKFNTDPQDSDINLFSLDAEFDLGFARLTSATAQSNVDVYGVSDSSGFLRTNLPQYYFGYPRIIAPIIRTQDTDTFTQEIRLVSQGDGTFEWVAGAFYLRNKLDYTLFQPMPGINDYANAYFGQDPPLNFTDVLATGGADQTFTDLAAFGELTWNITDAWQATLGARVFRQELKGTAGIPLPFASRTVEFQYYGTATNDFLLGGINPTNNKDSDAIFKLNTSYELNDETLAFFTYSQGFRAGGANQLPETDPFGNDNRPFLKFESDDAENYEIGIKGRWNSQLAYSATVFYVDWQDFQTSLSSPFGVNYVDNIGGAESKGLELEVNGAIGDRLTYALSYSYVDAETVESFEEKTGDAGTTVPAGTALPGASKDQLFASIQYEHPLANSSLAFYADAAYRSDTTSAFQDQPLLASENFAQLDDFTVVNASVSWVTEKYTVTLFGENLTNERGTSVVSVADFFGEQDQGFGVIKPLTVGLRFRWVY
jgi:outer membrane receptor protein involved in Fe transport